MFMWLQIVELGVKYQSFKKQNWTNKRMHWFKKEKSPLSLGSKPKPDVWNCSVMCHLPQSYDWPKWTYFSVKAEKAMAIHSSTLAWKIPRAEEPGRLPSLGSRRVGHDWTTSLSLFTFTHWRRKRQPTPVFLPGESQGRGSLVGCRLWGRTESDTTEAT